MSQATYIAVIGILVLWIIYLSEPIQTYPTADFSVTLHEDCLQAHHVDFGETPWSIAHYYVRSGYEYWWIQFMNQYSFIDPYDGRIYPGQYICVYWLHAPRIIWYDDREAITIWR